MPERAAGGRATRSACRSGGPSSRSCCPTAMAGLGHRRHAGRRPRHRRDRSAADHRRHHHRDQPQPVRRAHGDAAGVRYYQLTQPATCRRSTSIDRAWTAALLLIILVMAPERRRPPDQPLLRPQDRSLTGITRRNPRWPSASTSPTSTSTTATSWPSRASNVSIEPRSRHRPHRPLGLRQVDLPALPEPDARGASPAPGSRARSSWTARTSTAPSVDPVNVRRQIGMVFQRPNPFPTMSIYDNVIAGYRLNGNRKTKSRPRRPRRAVAARREPLERGQGPPRPARAPACPAASSSGCASPGRSPSSPRCC